MVHPSKRVVLTGANGFTGRVLTVALKARGHSVYGFGREQDVSWGVDGDLTDLNALESFFSDINPQVVMHLAGIASPVHGSVAGIYESNVVGTATLFEAILNSSSNPAIVLVASSATVYAETGKSKALVESDALGPSTHYGLSKLTVENICELFAPKINIRIVRPFNYTGPGQSELFLIPKIVAHFARNDRVIELGNLNLERDISDIDDVVEAYCRLINVPAGKPVNLCSGDAVKLSEIVELLRDISGRNVDIIINPKFIRENEPYRICGDRTELDHLIGDWNRRSLRETLNMMYLQAVRKS